MSIYAASSEENLRARKFLKDWTSDGLLSNEQYRRLEQETVSELRTTNIFLRLVLFFFTVVSVAAAVGLFFVIFLKHPSERSVGVCLLIFAVVCYAAAEAAVLKARLYRHGIEEALAVCSIGLVFAGLQSILLIGRLHSRKMSGILVLVPAVSAIFSVWIWRRFGPWYAFVAAMVFVVLMPGHWTTSHSALHAIIAGVYAIGLMSILVLQKRYRNDYFSEMLALAEAFLWLGIYLAINLKIFSLDLPQWWSINGGIASEFTRPFYWTTWVLTWCLPPVVLARAVREKNRFVLAVGMLTSIATFATNKPYLGWQRHSWDPMLLGILLAGVALFLRRWLAQGPEGIRHGFTAEPLSGKDKDWMNIGSTVMGLVSPHSLTPDPPPEKPDFGFGGGRSGGGGASGDF